MIGIIVFLWLLGFLSFLLFLLEAWRFFHVVFLRIHFLGMCGVMNVVFMNYVLIDVVLMVYISGDGGFTYFLGCLFSWFQEDLA